MYCRNCGKEIKEGQNFCPYCGTPTKRNPIPQSASASGSEKPEKSRNSGLTIAIIAAIVAALVIVAAVAIRSSQTGTAQTGEVRDITDAYQTIYDKDGLQIQYNGLIMRTDGLVIDFNAINNTGKEITTFHMLSVAMDGNGFSVDPIAYNIPDGSSGEYWIWLDNSIFETLGAEKEADHTIKFDLNLEFDQYGEASSMNLGSFCLYTDDSQILEYEQQDALNSAIEGLKEDAEEVVEEMIQDVKENAEEAKEDIEEHIKNHKAENQQENEEKKEEKENE